MKHVHSGPVERCNRGEKGGQDEDRRQSWSDGSVGILSERDTVDGMRTEAIRGTSHVRFRWLKFLTES